MQDTPALLDRTKPPPGLNCTPELVPSAWTAFEAEYDPPGADLLQAIHAHGRPSRRPTRTEAWAAYWPRADFGREAPHHWPECLRYTDELLSAGRQQAAMKRAMERQAAAVRPVLAPAETVSEPHAAPEPDPEALSRDWRRSGPKTQQHVVADPVYDRATAALVAALVAGLNERFLRFKLPLPVGLPELRQVFARILDDEAAVQALSSLRGEAPTTERAPSPTVVAALPKTPRDRLTARLWLARYAFVSLAETADWTDADLDEAGEIVTAMMDAEDDDGALGVDEPTVGAMAKRDWQEYVARSADLVATPSETGVASVQMPDKPGSYLVSIKGEAPVVDSLGFNTYRTVGHAQAAREREAIAAMVWEGLGILPDDPLPARVREIIVDRSNALEENRRLRTRLDASEASDMPGKSPEIWALNRLVRDGLEVVEALTRARKRWVAGEDGNGALGVAQRRAYLLERNLLRTLAEFGVHLPDPRGEVENGPVVIPDAAAMAAHFGVDYAAAGTADLSVETTARVEDGRVAEIVETRVAPTIRAAIEVNGKPGSARDLPTGSTVVLCSVENTGVATWRWRFRNLPDGSKGLLGNPDKPEAHLRLDVPGAYVVSLEVDDGHGGRSEANVVVQTREGRDERVAPRLHTLVAAEFGWEQVDGIRRAQVVTERQVVRVLSLVGSSEGPPWASVSVVTQDGPPSTIDLLALAHGQSFDLTDWAFVECWWIEDRYDVFARIRPAAG